MVDYAIDPTLPTGLPSDGRGTVITVGTFDGVHRGHWAVLQEIRRRAREARRRSVLVTFHPHPLQIVRPDHAPLLLTTPVEKKEILAETGLDYAVFLSFNHVLASYSPRRFVEEILVGRLGVEELVIGYDHGFGRGRSGDVDTLQEIGDELGFTVDVVSPVRAGENAVSSSKIREALSEGNVEAARAGLGRPYCIRGLVVRGDGRGRKLGFPTANLFVPMNGKLIPPAGVYAVRGCLKRGVFDGAIHIGPRPTFIGSRPTIELHLMDFEGDIYGEEVRVEFIRHLREVRPFDSASALVEQLRYDVEAARAALAYDLNR
ncbi:MAG: bifunctional riboflavin kinase/FAD synthetase [Gemmatimonadetes bacterium]|nr:bifunctional riboflavin kinase/FAD synthetase [Gemmatimonadota bacterium]NNM05530.1 bifunctional riboflavin kinase/FAD synthetase [Gemmatimonadota bacterium]